MKVQCWASQPVGPLVNFYIAELWVLFVERKTIEAQFSAHQPKSPRSKKVAKYGINTESLRDKKSAMLSQPTCKSTYQFIYRGNLGPICRTWNNRGSIFSPPGREPAIQKVPKYGMRDPHMLYKLSCSYFIKVHVYYVLLVCRKTFISLT
jgi:hypothetical protein